MREGEGKRGREETAAGPARVVRVFVFFCTAAERESAPAVPHPALPFHHTHTTHLAHSKPPIIRLLAAQVGAAGCHRAHARRAARGGRVRGGGGGGRPVVQRRDGGWLRRHWVAEREGATGKKGRKTRARGWKVEPWLVGSRNSTASGARVAGEGCALWCGRTENTRVAVRWAHQAPKIEKRKCSTRRVHC